MRILLNFILNWLRLIKATFISPRLNWRQFSSTMINCDISERSKVYNNFALSNVTVGAHTYIAQNSLISFTSIGNFCSLGPNLVCGWGIHPLNGISTSPVFYSTKLQTGFSYSKTDKVIERRAITIGNDVFIGANVTILDGVNIGDGAVIGAGAVVSKDIPAYAIAVGIPIKVVKYRFSKEIIEKLLESKWWNKDDITFAEIESNFFDVDKFTSRNSSYNQDNE